MKNSGEKVLYDVKKFSFEFIEGKIIENEHKNSHARYYEVASRLLMNSRDGEWGGMESDQWYLCTEEIEGGCLVCRATPVTVPVNKQTGMAVA